MWATGETFEDCRKTLIENIEETYPRSRWQLSRLTPVSGPERILRLKQTGLNGPYFGTKHLYMMKGNKTVFLRFLRDAGISREEWFSTE